MKNAINKSIYRFYPFKIKRSNLILEICQKFQSLDGAESKILGLNLIFTRKGVSLLTFMNEE